MSLNGILMNSKIMFSGVLSGNRLKRLSQLMYLLCSWLVLKKFMIFWVSFSVNSLSIFRRLEAF